MLAIDIVIVSSIVYQSIIRSTCSSIVYRRRLSISNCLSSIVSHPSNQWMKNLSIDQSLSSYNRHLGGFARRWRKPVMSQRLWKRSFLLSSLPGQLYCCCLKCLAPILLLWPNILCTTATPYVLGVGSCRGTAGHNVVAFFRNDGVNLQNPEWVLCAELYKRVVNSRLTEQKNACLEELRIKQHSWSIQLSFCTCDTSCTAWTATWAHISGGNEVSSYDIGSNSFSTEEYCCWVSFETLCQDTRTRKWECCLHCQNNVHGCGSIYSLDWGQTTRSWDCDEKCVLFDVQYPAVDL
jgi:hypothetical protein